jgi:hypothetical protein
MNSWPKGLSKAVSAIKPQIEQEIQDKKTETYNGFYDTGKTFIPKLKQTLGDDNKIIVCECGTARKTPVVEIVGYIKRTKELKNWSFTTMIKCFQFPKIT